MKRFLNVCMTLTALLMMSASVWAQEPYAVLSEDNTVLTFYYDGNKTARNGMDVGPFTISANYWGYIVNSGWFDYREQIKTVVFDDSFANCTSITSTAYWFYDFFNLTTITGIENLNSTNVTTMHSMFYRCFSLTSLDLSHLDTSNVMSMIDMFFYCKSLTSLNVSNFDTSKVTYMMEMFDFCSSLTSLNVSNFDTSKVTDMRYMFGHCNLTSIDVSNFDTGNVMFMNGMFCDCKSLTTIYVDETKWSTEKVNESTDMFYGSTKIVGGNGTVYNKYHIDKEYARIDKPGQPGYFTAKDGTSVDPGTDPNPDPGNVPDPSSFDTTFPEANVGTNRLKSITQIHSNGSEDKLELTYDDKGRVIKSVQYYDSGYNINVCDYSYIDGKIEVVLNGLRGQTGSMSLWLKNGKVSYVTDPSSSSGDEIQLYNKYEYDSSDRMIKEILGGPEPEFPAGFVYDFLPEIYTDIDWSDANPTKQTFYFLKTNGDIKIDEMGTYTYNNLTSQPIINALFSFGLRGQPCYVRTKELPLLLASYPYMGTLPKNMLQKIVWQIPGERGYELTYTYETDANGEVVKVLEYENNNLFDTYILEWENSAPIPVNPNLDPTASGSQDFDNGGGISGSSNLDGNVIGNVYYAIGGGSGGYNDVEGCIEITQPTNDSDIDGTDIFGENFRDHFTGIVFKVAPGSGVIKVNAETTGSMMLKVKVGNNLPYEMMLTGKVEAKFPYSVTEPTYVYIYASMLGSSAPNRAGASGDKLKIYGFSWQDATGITEKEIDTDANTYWYTLDGQRLNGQPAKKGVYIVNGRKVVVK